MKWYFTQFPHQYQWNNYRFLAFLIFFTSSRIEGKGQEGFPCFLLSHLDSRFLVFNWWNTNIVKIPIGLNYTIILRSNNYFWQPFTRFLETLTFYNNRTSSLFWLAIFNKKKKKKKLRISFQGAATLPYSNNPGSVCAVYKFMPSYFRDNILDVKLLCNKFTYGYYVFYFKLTVIHLI